LTPKALKATPYNQELILRDKKWGKPFERLHAKTTILFVSARKILVWTTRHMNFASIALFGRVGI